MNQHHNLLLVDDDEIVLRTLTLFLERAEYTVTPCQNGDYAMAEFNKNDSEIDLAIVDVRMQGMDGIELLKNLRQRAPDMPVILMTAYGDINAAIEALRLKADDYLLKPFKMDEFGFRISKCIQHAETLRKITNYEMFLPICCVCKKIRDDDGTEKGEGTWQQLESYLEDHTDIRMTHTLCPQCVKPYKDKIARTETAGFK